MTRLVGILLVLLFLFCGWRVFVYWDNFQKKQSAEANSVETDASNLPGMPRQLAPSYKLASRQGAAGIRNWLENYGNLVQDPSKAWIELDYCRDISRDNPVQAKLIFDNVKNRTPESSPVWPRIKQLESSFE
jgi:hypothetical protein